MGIDGQVCFHSWLSTNPVKPWRCTTGPVKPIGGINKDVCDASGMCSIALPLGFSVKVLLILNIRNVFETRYKLS